MRSSNEGGHGGVGCIYDQFAFWSLRFLDVTLLSLHFKEVCKASNNVSIAFEVA
jgi:hypothetical protein